MKKVKLSVDLAMTVLLLLLMGYMITGQQLHEWIGTAMLALFVLSDYGMSKVLFFAEYIAMAVFFAAVFYYAGIFIRKGTGGKQIEKN